MSDHHWFWLTDLWGQRKKEILTSLARIGMKETVITVDELVKQYPINPSDILPLKIEAWDEYGNSVGYTIHDRTVTFDRPPQAFRWIVNYVDEDDVQ